MSLLDKFNRSFQELLRDLALAFPTDPDFKMYQMAVRTSLLVNETMVQEIVHAYVVEPYGDRLLAQDESFFLTFDYASVAQGDQEVLAIIQKLKTAWALLDPANKDVVWKYFRVLILLDRKLTAASA